MKSKHMLSKGFTLIESLVALVILALVFGAFSEWLDSVHKASKRIEHYTILDETMNQSLSMLDTIDLTNIQQGEFSIGETEVKWRASVDQESRNLRYQRQPAWNIILYRIELDYYQAGERIFNTQTKVLRQQQLVTNDGVILEDM